MNGPLFYSKILLFGEYGIIEDSKGLSIPYNFYKGALKIPNKKNSISKASNKILRGFLKHLKSSKIKLNLDKFSSDIDKGLYFNSSIPEGYGIGSSGALVAAVYDKYAFERITVLENLTREKLINLKNIFSIMESYFHGKSSGLDPLNSYLSIPILINSRKDIKVTGIPSQKSTGNGAVFLIDSGKISSTAPMVNIFMESQMMHMIITYAGVLIFVGLTAYDTQKIKEMNIIGNEGTDEDTKEAIHGALTLYLDFINLFLMLLRLMGDRR